MALQITVDPNAPVPAYRQIVDQMRTLMVERALPPGTSLPPVRRLALDLGVHFNTVAEAYRVLEQEGFLTIRHGRGALVAERTQEAHAPEDRQRELTTLRKRLRELIAERRASGLSTRQIARELRGMVEVLEA